MRLLDVRAIDMDGDGDIDIISGDDGTVTWSVNNGRTPPEFDDITISSGAAISIYPADYDNDGNLDIAWTGDSAAAWYTNDGTSTIRIVDDASARIATSGSVYAADIINDGAVDMLVANPERNTIAWYKSNGKFPPSFFPEFEKFEITTSASIANSVIAFDFDGDGDLDVLMSSHGDNTIAWHENECSLATTPMPTGVLARQPMPVSPTPQPVEPPEPSPQPTPGPFPSPTETAASTANPSTALPEQQPTQVPSLQPTEMTIPTTAPPADRPTQLSKPSPRPTETKAPTPESTEEGRRAPNPNSESSAQPTPSPNSESSPNSQSTSSATPLREQDWFWAMVGIVVTIILFFLGVCCDAGRSPADRQCSPIVHFYCHECCKFGNCNFEAYRTQNYAVKGEIDPLQHVRGLFSVMDTDGDGRVTRENFITALTNNSELADFFNLPRRIEQDSPTRESFNNIFRFIAEDDDDFDEARWFTRTANFQNRDQQT